MITVIIPALNEAKTIRHVVAQAKNTPLVTEIIVVDDKSMDDTVTFARAAGAKVITSTRLGKGASMKDGVSVATNDILVFLDADILTYPNDVVKLLSDPILTGKADFVKSWFTRQAGRVTELVAKPLLHILHPDFPMFRQPLSGMIAGKKSFFIQCEFENGYGVDIGILLDMHRLGAKIAEVHLGKLENRMQSLEELGKMSREVAGTILKKSPDGKISKLEVAADIHVIRGQMEFAVRDSLRELKKIAVFDMDNTILRASFIQTAAKVFGFTKELDNIVATQTNPFLRTKLIAQLLKDKTLGELLKVADSIPVTDNLEPLIQALRKKGYIIGIISDSYDCITQHIRNRFGFDFAIANELEFSRSVVTGEVKIPFAFIGHDGAACDHAYCKTHALRRICHQYDIDITHTLVIGDGENDICSIDKAGLGIAFCSANAAVDDAADHVIGQPDFGLLIPLMN